MNSVTRFLKFPLTIVLLAASTALIAQQAATPGLTDRSALASATVKHFHATPHDLTNGNAHSRFGIHGIDSIPNFNGQFFANGIDEFGNPNRHWYTNTVGNPPQMGGTTWIGAPIQPINIELDDVNGNLLVIGGQPMISLATPFVAPTLGSPVFSNSTYSSSSTPTQFVDAVARAEFFNNPMKPNWHTLLSPSVLPAITLHIPQSSTCPSGPNFAGCNYVFALNGDGSCCAFILVNDVPPDFVFDSGLANAVVTDINNNGITTKNISTFLYPNVYIFFGDITQCCVLGYHTYFFSPGDPEQRWVLNYSSWISPGLFGSAFVDVTGLSHEMSETFNDPFVVSDGVHNLTPWWLAPNGECQDDRETGDVIEGLPNATIPITLNGFTYHPQNEALLQWFEFKSPSDALDGAYSYPDETVLTAPSTPQNYGCQ